MSAVLNEMDAEILFIDDSDDSTPNEIRRAAPTVPTTVRLLHRPSGQRLGGLGGAVKKGIEASDAAWLVVMDGDLQHPPELTPELIGAGDTLGLDVVVASRYGSAEGDAAGLSSAGRRLVSSWATLAARTLFPRALSQVTDPMSGYFAMRRSAVDATELRPDGFKILLEILVRTRNSPIGEVPFVFGIRHGGTSKASFREGLRYLRLLLRLRMSVSCRPHIQWTDPVDGLAPRAASGAA